MRHLLFVAVLLSVWGVRAQDPPTINTDLPTIIPPSPTVASLMKFEEIPVNHYTGVPDITIPIFSSKTRSKDISVSVSLKYHPSDIQVANVASWTGLGWSLFAGGTISRTVRGEADNNLINEKGIYSNQNPFLSLFYNLSGDFVYDDTSYARQDFLWLTQTKGRYDTQYDLYQFSFQGHSGRFTLAKNGEVQKLYNDTAVQIIYNSSNDSFTAYDDKGYRYVFDVRETSSDFRSVYNVLRDGTDTNPVLPQSPVYTSSYHLSSIYDNNNGLLASFSYETVTEEYENRVMTINQLYGLNETNLEAIVAQQCDDVHYDLMNYRNITPRWSVTTTHVTTQTKKLQSIIVQGVSRIHFESESGRLDMNSGAKRLKRIIVEDWAENQIKRIDLKHTYEGAGNRLVLNSLEDYGAGVSSPLETKLFYNNIGMLPDKFSKKKDSWGYFNNSGLATDSFLDGNVSPAHCTTGVLEKMLLPTGGCYIFNFESNQYSYEANQPLSVFPNPDNEVSRTFQNSYTGYSSENSSVYGLVYITTDQDVSCIIETLNNPTPVTNKKVWYFSLIPIDRPEPEPGSIEIVFSDDPYQVDTNRQIHHLILDEIDPSLSTNYFQKGVSLKKGYYAIRFYHTGEMIPNPVEYFLKINYRTYTDTYKYVNGGGLRIKRAGYFTDGSVPQTYYRDIEMYPQFQHGVPDFEKKYEYSFFNNPNRSSGSLTFPKPLYSYPMTISHLIRCVLGYKTLSLDFNIITDYNNLSPFKTHGADVGYKNVTVTTNHRTFDEVQGPLGMEYFPVDNAFVGREEYTFTSSIDEPEPFYDLQYPFSPSPNYDYKRGLLTKKEVFDADNRILNSTLMSYDFVEDERITGIRTYTLLSCGFNDYWNSFGGYHSVASDPNCDQTAAPHCDYHCGYPIFHMINFRPVKEAYGWARLVERTTRDFHYEGTVPLFNQTRETYTYNPDNKRLASHSVQTDNSSVNPQVLKTDYFYHSGNSSYSQNRIAEVEEIRTYQNNELISKGKIQYANTFPGNASWLPQTILDGKGDQALEPKVHFVRYDEYGNPVEVMQEEGTPVVYIWGYHKTQPIAKIENATWTQVQSYVANLQSLSDTGTEAALITALDNLRMVLPNAMVTTMTYKPLVGVSTMTDPAGYRMKYFYDNFNRLKEVRDMNDNLVTEHEYRYRD